MRLIHRRFLNVIPSVLNGESIVTATKVPVISHNGDVIHHYLPLEDPKALVSKICSDAYAGYLEWSAKPYTEVSEILLRAADSIASDRNTFVDAHCAIGSSRQFAEVVADSAVASIREYALLASRPDGTIPKTLATDLALSVRTPIGPVLSIAPWNAPTILWTRAIVAPLAAGCSVVMKSSEKAPMFPYLYTEHLLAAGVSKQALQLVQVGPQDHALVTEAFLQNDYIRKVNFTGLTAVGAKIAEMAAKNLTPALLELGGKNVSVVCKDADIAKAAFDLVFSAWLHKGQICMCLDSVYVDDSIYDEFVTQMLAAADKLALAPDFQLNQRDEAVAKKVEALVSDAVEKGAQVLYGSPSTVESSNYSPLVLGGVQENMDIHSNEVFGPVVAVSRFSDLDNLVRTLNSSSYGLKASVWSRDVVSAIKLAKRLEIGGIHINSSSIHDEATIAHGGVKSSGYGRFNSTWGIDEFTYTKTITLS